MSLVVAIQMDPLESINIDTDSTFVLGLEAQRRGYTLYHYTPFDLSWREGRVFATARPFRFRRERGRHFEAGAEERLDLASVDVVLMRQDPPFNLAYISATHLLDRLPPRVLVVNDPTSVRNAPEKLFVTEFHDLMPPTLITYDLREIRAFKREHGDVVVKPLYGAGGSGVFLIRAEDVNLNSLYEFMRSYLNEPLMVQKYLPAVRAGDKRIVLVDGRPVGAVNRIPPPDDARANLHVGGRPQQTSLTPRDLEICARIGPVLEARGLVFVGIDVIGGFLTEINVTSPTGLQEIDRLEGCRLEADIWDAIERRLAARRAEMPPR